MSLYFSVGTSFSSPPFVLMMFTISVNPASLPMSLMYLSGMDVYDIIKITGHTSPVMLRKYIKADELEVVEKITGKYTYFD